MELVETLYNLTDIDAVREELKDNNQREYFKKLVECLELVHEAISDKDLSVEAERVAKLILAVIKEDLPTSYCNLLNETLHKMYETCVNLRDNTNINAIDEIYKDALHVYTEKFEEEQSKVEKSHIVGAPSTGVPRNDHINHNDSISSYPETEVGTCDNIQTEVGTFDNIQTVVGTTFDNFQAELGPIVKVIRGISEPQDSLRQKSPDNKSKKPDHHHNISK